MAWIEAHQALFTHRKTMALADALDMDETAVAGHLIRFWTWAIDNAQDGNLDGVSDRAIAVGAGWKGDHRLFVAAMFEAGWLDADRTIHDWWEYAGRLIERRRSEADRKAASRTQWESAARDRRKTGAGQAAPTNEEEDGTGAGQAQDRLRPGAGQAQDRRKTGGVTVPYLTVPNPTVPNTTNTTTTPPAPAPEESEQARPLTAAADSSSDALSRCMTAWTNATGFTVSRTVADAMLFLLETVPEDWVVDAIKETALNGKRSWNYTAAILARWQTDGREVAPPANQEPQRRTLAEVLPNAMSRDEAIAAYGRTRMARSS